LTTLKIAPPVALLAEVHDQDPQQLAARKQQSRSADHLRVADGEVVSRFLPVQVRLAPWMLAGADL
jgi:hypothetical protein